MCVCVGVCACVCVCGCVCVCTFLSVDVACFRASNSFFQAGNSGSFLAATLVVTFFLVTGVVPVFFSRSFFFHSGMSESVLSLSGPVGEVGVGERDMLCDRKGGDWALSRSEEVLDVDLEGFLSASVEFSSTEAREKENNY